MPQIILLVGPQGSGKTTYAKKFPEFTRISQDEQGKSEHFKLFLQAVSAGEDIIVDRINHTRSQRDRYLSVARENNYHTSILVKNLPYQICLNRVMNREDHPTLKSDNQFQVERAISHYFSNYEYVTDQEADLVSHGTFFDPYFLDLSNMYSIAYIVGDLHGCYDEFLPIVEKATTEGACVILTGDIVDRGPKIRECLDECMNNDRVYSVMGNHDDKLLRYLRGNNVSISHGLQETIDQCGLHDIKKCSDLRHFLENLPMVIKFGDSYVFHAGINPKWSILRQPREWLLYTRTWNRETNSFNDDSAPPWFEFYTGDNKLFFGHQYYEETQVAENVFALDGGCVFGKELRYARVVR